jgi:hypothetical protein
MNRMPMSAAAPSPAVRRPLSRRKKLAFALLPLVLLFAVAELVARGLRAAQGRGSFWSPNFRVQRLDLVRAAYPVAHDPLLGYVPKAGAASSDNRWRAQVSIDAAGLRQNGGPRPAAARGVLAVGDSFTFGDQVSDHETWPAGLERELQVPVWNGGVFGYSFAQAVLRAEQLLPQLTADRLVLSFIADDLRRCEFSARYAEVPWFAIDGDTLQLRGVPVPARAPRRSDEPFVQHLLGHSAALDWLCWNTVPVWWVGDQREVRVHEKGTGARIAELLLTRLAALCRQRGVRLVLVLQGYEIGADADRVLAFARSHDIDVLDLVRAFQREAAGDPGMYTRCFDGHMTAAGNAWVAQQLAVALRRD